MNKKINLLLLEDNAIDAELIERELRRAGFEFATRRVETESQFTAELEKPLDIVLADFRLPQFDGLQALRHVQQRNLDVPFIIVSAALGDELAAQCIKHGVTDYLVKDRL
ncbi:MAG TPA: response regulator, partial [Opitutus sp.]|nr:response regulator [Opitutus sp.]